MISEVPIQSLDAVWHQLGPMIERGLRHGQGDSTNSVLMREAIREGRMSLWAVHEGEDIQAGVVLSVTENPKGRKLYVELLAGQNMSEWVDEVENIVREAKDLVGAMCIEASCRKGLAKYLGKRGWKQKAIIMEMT